MGNFQMAVSMGELTGVQQLRVQLEGGFLGAWQHQQGLGHLGEPVLGGPVDQGRDFGI
jgi:hypothetical protein